MVHGMRICGNAPASVGGDYGRPRRQAIKQTEEERAEEKRAEEGAEERAFEEGAEEERAICCVACV